MRLKITALVEVASLDEFVYNFFGCLESFGFLIILSCWALIFLRSLSGTSGRFARVYFFFLGIVDGWLFVFPSLGVSGISLIISASFKKGKQKLAMFVYWVCSW